MEKKGSASYDPGWNDPPMFSYESQTAQLKSSKPRTFLNKRVAFPLNSASPPSPNFIPVDPTAPLPACDISNLPPPPSVPITTQADLPLDQIKDNKDYDTEFNDSQALEAVMNNFQDVLDIKFGNEHKDRIEIQRRLDTMKKLWIEDKLCKDIQQRILLLSEVLKKEELEKADDLQKGLMVDHGPACSLWMSGVRHLIHHQEPELQEPQPEEPQPQEVQPLETQLTSQDN